MENVGITAEGDDLLARPSSGPELRIPFHDLTRILAIRFGERFMGLQHGWVVFEADPVSLACDFQKCPGVQQVLFRDWRERIDASGILRTADSARRPPQFRAPGLFSPAPKLLLMTRSELATALAAADIVGSMKRLQVFDLDLDA